MACFLKDSGARFDAGSCKDLETRSTVGGGAGSIVGLSVGGVGVGVGISEGFEEVKLSASVGCRVAEGVGPIGVEYGVGSGVGAGVGACVLFATLHASGVDSPTNFRKSLAPHFLQLHKPGSSP